VHGQVRPQQLLQVQLADAGKNKRGKIKRVHQRAIAKVATKAVDEIRPTRGVGARAEYS
jgi:hypothetical protein